MRRKAIFFDLGETLLDETGLWSFWADRLGVPRFTLMALLGSTIESNEPHRRALEVLGVDLERARPALDAVPSVGLAPQDLYPDARPCLEQLKAAGYILGIAGNTPASWERVIRSWGLPVDLVATSGGLGAEKPAPEFFARLAAAAGVRPDEAAYVGDRLDKDVRPAQEAGFLAVFLRRGPWGYRQALWPMAGPALLRIDSLAELPKALERLDATQSSSQGSQG